MLLVTLRQTDEYVVQVLIDQNHEVIDVFTSNNTLKGGALVQLRPTERDDTGATAMAIRTLRVGASAR